MPRYRITDPKTGKTVTVSGDAPPSDQDLEEIFASAGLRGEAPSRRPRHTSFRAQIAEDLANPATPPPVKSPGEIGQNYSDIAGGAIVGVPASAVGFPGDIEQLGRAGLATVGVPVSRETAFPTSEEVANAVMGAPANEYVATGRIGGGFMGPFGTMRALGAVPGVLRAGARIANRATEAVTGTGFLNPEVEAISRLRATTRRVPVAENVAEWQATGASGPSLVDVGGNRARRLVRAAASGGEGEAQTVAQKYANTLTGNLQDRASGLARQLTPNEPRPANIVADELETTQQNLAREQYREPYAQPAAVTREMVSALQGPEGRRAINEAYRTARANRDQEAMAELSDLRSVAMQQRGGADPLTGRYRSLEQALAGLSSGSLDRVRIAMRERAGALAREGRGARARGYFGRVRDIDTALDQTEGLTEARGTYRAMQAQRDAIEAGRMAVNTPADTYAAEIGRLATISPDARGAAGIGYRQAIVEGIERPAAGSTGFLNRLATAEEQAGNLETTFGLPPAQRFQAGIANEIRRIENARFISPNTGSQTALRAEDAALIDALPFGQKVGFVARIMDGLRQGITLSNGEREAIVRLGTSEARLREVAGSGVPPSRFPTVATTLLLSGTARTTGRETGEQQP